MHGGDGVRAVVGGERTMSEVDEISAGLGKEMRGLFAAAWPWRSYLSTTQPRVS